ncbi:MAG: LCCL domain-containing protein [Cyanobacteria bacterium P01_C01_bin.72]
MKIIKASSRRRFIILSLALSLGIMSWQSANAQTSSTRLAEIGWSSRLSSMGVDKKKNIGRIYDFYCQAASEDLIHAPIWGTNIYTSNSGICSTAVHSGMISEEGGFVSIELLAGQEFYTGSIKNGLESKDHIGTHLSYIFIGEALTNNYSESETNQQRRPSTIKRVMVNSVQRGVERSIERIITDIFD